jgi:hypothetical protein
LVEYNVCEKKKKQHPEKKKMVGENLSATTFVSHVSPHQRCLIKQKDHLTVIVGKTQK